MRQSWVHGGMYETVKNAWMNGIVKECLSMVSLMVWYAGFHLGKYGLVHNQMNHGQRLTCVGSERGRIARGCVRTLKVNQNSVR